MDETLETLPRLRRPAAVNAAEYWIAPERFTRAADASVTVLSSRCPPPARGCA